MVRCFRFLLVLVFVFILHLPGVAYSQQAEIATLRWPPFRLVGESGAISGLDVDIMAAVSAEIGIDFKFQEYPWPRCLKYMQSGKTDFMTGLAKSPDREAYIYYTDKPYYMCSPRFYARAGRGFMVKQYGDLRGKRIGTCRDSKYFEQFDRDMSLDKRALITEEAMLYSLAKGRVDIIVGTDCQVQYDLQRLNLQDEIEEAEYKPGPSVRLYVGVSKKSPYAARIDDLGAALEKLKHDGVIDELARKYFPSKYMP